MMTIRAASSDPLNVARRIAAGRFMSPARILSRSEGRVTLEPRRTKVAIIGGMPSRGRAPWSDASWEIWGANNFWAIMPRAERWFEIHQPGILHAEEKRNLRRATGIPVYMAQAYAWAPSSVRFPSERVRSQLGLGFHAQMFTCTFCYQIALAIMEGFEEIGIFGVDFSSGSARERVFERAGVLFWIGVALGRGIRVTTADAALVTHTKLYGIEYWPEVLDVRRQLVAMRPLLTKYLDDFDLKNIKLPKGAKAKARRVR